MVSILFTIAALVSLPVITYLSFVLSSMYSARIWWLSTKPTFALLTVLTACLFLTYLLQPAYFLIGPVLAATMATIVAASPALLETLKQTEPTAESTFFLNVTLNHPLDWAFKPMLSLPGDSLMVSLTSVEDLAPLFSSLEQAYLGGYHVLVLIKGLNSHAILEFLASYTPGMLPVAALPSTWQLWDGLIILLLSAAVLTLITYSTAVVTFSHNRLVSWLDSKSFRAFLFLNMFVSLWVNASLCGAFPGSAFGLPVAHAVEPGQSSTPRSVYQVTMETLANSCFSPNKVKIEGGVPGVSSWGASAEGSLAGTFTPAPGTPDDILMQRSGQAFQMDMHISEQEHLMRVAATTRNPAILESAEKSILANMDYRRAQIMQQTALLHQTMPGVPAVVTLDQLIEAPLPFGGPEPVASSTLPTLPPELRGPAQPSGRQGLSLLRVPAAKNADTASPVNTPF